MPPLYDNIALTPPVDGAPYAVNVLCPAAEGDVGSPLSVTFESFAGLVVELTPQNVPSHTTYVILQTDYGDGVWIDCSWCTYTGLGLGVFVLSGGSVVATSFQRTRTSGSAPSPANGQNAIPLGGRVRVVAKSSLSSSSSSSSLSGGSAAPGVLITARLKLQGLR